jgi:hypothetical protein
MNNKSTKRTSSESEGNSLLQKAGDVISNIGSQIVEGKDKVVEVVSEEYNVVKKAIKKKFAGKKAPKKSVRVVRSKKAAKKSPVKKSSKAAKKSPAKKSSKAAKKSPAKKSSKAAKKKPAKKRTK